MATFIDIETGLVANNTHFVNELQFEHPNNFSMLKKTDSKRLWSVLLPIQTSFYLASGLRVDFF